MGLKNRADFEKDSYFVLRSPDMLEISDDFQLVLISLALFLQICKVQSRHGLSVLEQDTAPACTPLMISHPSPKSLLLGVHDTSSGGLFSSGSGITKGDKLGHCTVQAGSATPCFVDLQKAWGKVASDVNTSFSRVNGIERTLKSSVQV